MQDIEIRSATEKDRKIWAETRAKLWPDLYVVEHMKEIDKLMATDYECWLAMKGDECVGFVEASVRPFANGCESMPVAFVEGIWVDKNYRRNQLGGKLIKEVERWAARKGLSELGSDALLANTDSQKTHEQWGFEESERVVYYRKSIDPSEDTE